MSEQNYKRRFTPGRVVVDRKLYERGQTMYGVVLSTPYSSAQNERVNGRRVCDFELNKEYDRSAPVVDIILKSDMREETLVNGDFTIYTYPVPRLGLVDIQKAQKSSEEPVGKIEELQAIGVCAQCNQTITSKQNQYITGTDGRTFCSIECHNETVTQ